MNSQQVQDIRLMYEAVYNNELREKADEYNSMIRDEDIVEVATEYFYTYGLNSTGVDILIEKVGLDNFVEFVYDLSEGLILTEAKKTSKAKKQPSMLASQRAKLAAQKAAAERTETEKKEPESKGADTEAKSEQPKSKKPEKGGIRGAIERGMERHRLATTVASKVAQKAGPALGKGLMHGVGGTLGLIGKIASSGLKEEFEYWVNSLIEEGYDLSDYTWDDMVEIYMQNINEASPSNPNLYTGRHGETPAQYQRNRSDAGKRISGNENSGPNYYTRGRSRGATPDAPTAPGARPVNTPKVTQSELDYARTVYKSTSGKDWNKIGGPKGLPKGGGNSAQYVTDDPNSRPIASRWSDYKIGGGARYGISGIGLADSYDMFDAILEYLVAEGYADTNEDALAIMANMSEEWREEIINEEVRGAKKGTIRSVIEKGGKSIKYVQSGGDIVAGDRAAAERASAADRTRSGRNRANAARAEQAQKKSIETMNSDPNESPDHHTITRHHKGKKDSEDLGVEHYHDEVPTDYRARRRRASGR